MVDGQAVGLFLGIVGTALALFREQREQRKEQQGHRDAIVAEVRGLSERVHEHVTEDASAHAEFRAAIAHNTDKIKEHAGDIKELKRGAA